MQHILQTNSTDRLTGRRINYLDRVHTAVTMTPDRLLVKRTCLAKSSW